jgi:hypothetical protein
MTGFRILLVSFLTSIFWLTSFYLAPIANASTPIKLSNLSYTSCPSEITEGAYVGSGDMGANNCFLVRGKANNASGKAVVDADVFGRIYDANGNSAMENRGRIGTIPEVPPGVSDFEIRISVSANQPTPLTLKQFKASVFASKVRPYYYDDFED